MPGATLTVGAALLFIANVVSGQMGRPAFEVRISRGEPWRSIAAGIWSAGGRLLLRQPTEPFRQAA